MTAAVGLLFLEDATRSTFLLWLLRVAVPWLRVIVDSRNVALNLTTSSIFVDSHLSPGLTDNGTSNLRHDTLIKHFTSLCKLLFSLLGTKGIILCQSFW